MVSNAMICAAASSKTYRCTYLQPFLFWEGHLGHQKSLKIAAQWALVAMWSVEVNGDD